MNRQFFGQIKKKMTIFDHWCIDEIFLIHSQMSGSSLTRFVHFTCTEFFGLEAVPITELPDVWHFIKEMLSYISKQKYTFSFQFTPRIANQFLEQAIIEIDFI